MVASTIFADTLVGSSAADVLVGLDGSDLIVGNAGDDSILGNGGADFLMGGKGNDTVKGGAGRDTVLGGVGDDEVFGGSGHDVLSGDQGTDTLIGGTGDDTFAFFDFAADGSVDTISDYEANDNLALVGFDVGSASFVDNGTGVDVFAELNGVQVQLATILNVEIADITVTYFDTNPF